MKALIVTLVTISTSIVGFAAAAENSSSNVMDMRGFKVEYGQVGIKKLEDMRSSLDRQLRIVEEANVPPEVLDFFKSVPVIILPKIDTGFGHAEMVNGRQVVELKAAELPRDRPILLHELLHAYHGQKIGPNPTIREAYQEAIRSNIYPKKYANAHFLENPREYFAVIGSIFLYGKKIDQPPFDCEITAKAQPQFIEFLTKQFGPHQCR